MDLETRQKLSDHLGTFLTDARKRRIETVLSGRTRFITVILEDIYREFNASACLRSCEAYGIQEVHVIENEHDFKVRKTISQGTHHWLDIINHREEGHGTEAALQFVKEKGYRIIATSPSPKAKDYRALDLAPGPIALLMGSERDGLSEKAFEMADETVSIPILGFAESFNITVSTAVILADLRKKLGESNIDWGLKSEDIIRLRHEWYRRSVRESEMIEQAFLESGEQA